MLQPSKASQNVSIHLTSLPIEILLNISSHLTTVEYGSLRLTCKDIERKLFDFFANEFFQIRQVCLYPGSLDNLVAISKHTELRKVVKKVIICLESLNPMRLPSHNSNASSIRDIHLRHSYAQGTGGWTDYLETALPNLPILKTIEIRDFISQKLRPRDGTPWRSYLVPTLNKLTQRDMILHHEDGSCRMLFPTLLRGLAGSGIKLESLEFITRKHAHAAQLQQFFIPEHLHPKFSAFLGCLRTLMIHLVCPYVSDYVGLTETAFRSMLGFTTSLEHLRVNFSYFDSFRDYSNSLVPSCTLLDALSALQGRSLKKLEIGFAEINGHGFRFLAPLKDSIEHLGLHRVTFESRDEIHHMLRQLEAVKELKSFSALECRVSESHMLWKGSAATELVCSELCPHPKPILCVSSLRSETSVITRCTEDTVNEFRGRMLIVDREVREQFNATDAHELRFISKENTGKGDRILAFLHPHSSSSVFTDYGTDSSFGDSEDEISELDVSDDDMENGED